MSVEKVTRERIKEILGNLSTGGSVRYATIVADENTIHRYLEIENDNLVEEIIATNSPSELFVNIFWPDGSSGDGRKKYALKNQYEVILKKETMGSVKIEEEPAPDSKSSIEDATIMEDKSTNFKQSGPLNVDPAMGVYQFAYMKTDEDLKDLKSKYHLLELENKRLESEKRKMELEILRHEQDAKDLRKEVESSKGMSGITSMVANNPTLSSMAGDALAKIVAGVMNSNGHPAQPQMTGPASQQAQAIAQWVSEKPEATQQIIFEMFRVVADSYDGGNEDILNVIINQVNSYSESHTGSAVDEMMNP